MSYSVGAEQHSLHRINPTAELMDKKLLARIALLEAAVLALLRVHPVPEQGRDELRHAAERVLSSLDDAPDHGVAATTALQYNVLCEALAC